MLDEWGRAGEGLWLCRHRRPMRFPSCGCHTPVAPHTTTAPLSLQEALGVLVSFPLPPVLPLSQ